MKITMREGYEFTPEIESLSSQYDWFAMYIDDYSDRCLAEERNLEINIKLDILGVLRFENS